MISIDRICFTDLTIIDIGILFSFLLFLENKSGINSLSFRI